MDLSTLRRSDDCDRTTQRRSDFTPFPTAGQSPLIGYVPAYSVPSIRCRREALTTSVPAPLQPSRSPPSQLPLCSSQLLLCSVQHGRAQPTSPIHSSKPVLATPYVHPNYASTTRTAATSHSKRIALSCQTGQASFNAPYRKHRGPSNVAYSPSFHCRGASDTLLGVFPRLNSEVRDQAEAGYYVDLTRITNRDRIGSISIDGFKSAAGTKRPILGS